MSRLPKTISVEKLDNSVLFTFAQNQHYLYDGTIEVPLNSLSIIADKSEAITLRKSASNDIFISAPWQNFDINASSKEDVVAALTDMLYDEAGISEEEVQEMIDEATSGMPSSQVVEQLRTDVNTISGNVQTLSGEVATKADASDLQALSEKVDTKLDASAYTPTDLSEYWTSAETKSYVDGKVDDALDDYYDKDYVDAALADKLDASAYTPTDLSEYWTSAQTQSAIDAATSGIPSSQVIEQLRNDVNTISGNVENNYYDKDYIDEKEEVTAAALNDLNDRISSGGGALFVNFDDLRDNMNDEKWDELVNALQNNKPIFAIYNGSEGDTTDAGQSPVDTYVYINQTEGEEDTEIELRQLYSGGYRELIIRKNGSEDYEVTDDNYDYQPMGDYQPTLQAGSGISIDENNVISVAVDSELDETSNNPVANSAVTTAIIDDEEVISRAINDLNDRLVAVESGGSSVTVDTSLDSGSTNPVANSAITSAINAKQDTLSAGTGIEISGNVISATGGSSVTVDPTLDSGSTNPVANSAITTAIDNAKAYYIDFGVLSTQGIHDADWDGMVNAINAHRPIYAGLGGEYYVSECLAQTENRIILTASNHLAHFIYTFTKNGSEDYSFSSETRAYVTDAEKTAWNAKQDALSAGTGIEISGNVISATGGGSVTVDPTLDTGSTNPVANSAITNVLSAYYYARKTNKSVYNNPFNKKSSNGCVGFSLEFSNIVNPNDSSTGGLWVSKINNKDIIGTDYSAPNSNTFNLSLVETSAITSSITSASTNDEVAGAKATFDALDAKADASTTYTKTEVNNLVNNKFWCGTQAQYDALATKENDVLYLIHE